MYEKICNHTEIKNVIVFLLKISVMKILLIPAFIFSMAISYSQQPTIAWQKCVGGTAGEYGWSIKEQSNGIFIACGYTDSNDGYFPNNHGNDDAVIFELTATGVPMGTNAVLYGGSEDDEAKDVVCAENYSYVFVGSTSSNDGNVSGNHGYDDVWVVKVDVLGNIVWQKCFGGSDDDRGEAIIQTSDGGYILVGSTYSSDGDVTGYHGNSYMDVWVVKISSTGALEWQKCYGGTETEEGYSIAQASNGDYIVAGYTSSNDGDVSGNQGGRDSWIFRINSTGTLLWQKCLGGANTEEFNSICINSDGTIMALGYSNSTGGDLLNAGGHGDDDFWVVKLSATGNVLFSKCYGGPYADQANRMAMTTDGNYVLCGLATANGGDISGLHTSIQGPDIWVAKIDPTGTLLWQKCLGGYNQDEGLYICATADGNCVAAGFTYSNGGDVNGNHGNKDMWFVKLEGGGSGIHSPTISDLNVFPNPFVDLLLLEFAAEELTITSMSGEVVYEYSGKEISEINLSHLAEGSYILNIGNRYRTMIVKSGLSGRK